MATFPYDFVALLYFAGGNFGLVNTSGMRFEHPIDAIDLQEGVHVLLYHSC